MSRNPDPGPGHPTPEQWVRDSFPAIRGRLVAFARCLAERLPAALDATPLEGEDLLQEAVLRVLRNPRLDRSMTLDELCRVLAGTLRNVASEIRRYRLRRSGGTDSPGSRMA